MGSYPNPSITKSSSFEIFFIKFKCNPASLQVICKFFKGAPDNSNCPPGSREIEEPDLCFNPIKLLFSLIFSQSSSSAILFKINFIPFKSS